ncbi:hypothetical protein NC651_001548 [Populus alba x Populus x berolinensis]|nr:hypothetical protein NC651_001548 [Populus alba x Populus x berolinensis]
MEQGSVGLHFCKCLEEFFPSCTLLFPTCILPHTSEQQ